MSEWGETLRNHSGRPAGRLGLRRPRAGV